MGNELSGIAPSQIVGVESYLSDLPNEFELLNRDARWGLFGAWCYGSIFDHFWNFVHLQFICIQLGKHEILESSQSEAQVRDDYSLCLIYFWRWQVCPVSHTCFKRLFRVVSNVGYSIIIVVILFVRFTPDRFFFLTWMMIDWFLSTHRHGAVPCKGSTYVE